MDKALQGRVRAALEKRGVLEGGREVIWSAWNTSGWRVSILRPMKGSVTVEEKSITVRELRGSLKDQVNGIVGNLLREVSHA